MSESVKQHRSEALSALRVAVVTVSDSRTIETDASGALIVELLEAAGHQVVERTIIPDEPVLMRELLVRLTASDRVHAVLLTGGTGITARDQTFETVSSLLTKPLPGYGELFRMLSYTDIGPACMLSRAVGGLVGRVAVFSMPGSRAAVELAMRKVMIPELPHVVREAHKH